MYQNSKDNTIQFKIILWKQLYDGFSILNISPHVMIYYTILTGINRQNNLKLQLIYS